MRYRRDDVKAPKMSGLALKAFVAALESGIGPILLEKLVKDSGIDRWREQSAGDAPAVQYPLPHPATQTSRQHPFDLAAAAVHQAPPSKRETVAQLVAAYREGVDPVAVVRTLHSAIERLDERDERLGLFIARKPEEVLREAEASAQRHRAGRPLSVLDGVPIVLKDEVDLSGFATTLGTRFRNEIATTDSTVAARLKEAGAVILGKANMNEIGINPSASTPGMAPHETPGTAVASQEAVQALLQPSSPQACVH